MAFNTGTIDTGIGSEFNGVFLAYLIVCGVLSVFFLLYFNRAFASLVSWGIRTWSWHRYRIYIDITALQISLLGGRVFFTGLRYHGNNETILIQNGHITWSYWLRRVRDAEVGIKAEKGVGDGAGEVEGDATPHKAASRSPCRVNVAVHGLEWFVYNRSAAYDSVLAGLTEENGDGNSTASPTESMPHASSNLRERSGHATESKEADTMSPEDGATHRSRISKRRSKQEQGSFNQSRNSASNASSSTAGRDSSEENNGQQDDLPLLLRLFPINVECQTAALVMGNENTKAILIIKADSVSSDIDASDAQPSTPDPYRQIFRLKFQHPVIEIKDNLDFKETQAERATREKQVARSSQQPVQTRSFFRRQRRRIVGQVRGMVPYWRRSVESFSSDARHGPPALGTPQIPGFSHWQGLTRYLDDGDDQKARWATVEYASPSVILDSPEATMVLFWDVVGQVPSISASSFSDPSRDEYGGNINGQEPPAWTITLAIKGGSVNYGPWADRQRADLQRNFFPGLCKDAIPAARLAAGAYRVPTQFKFFVQLEDDATIRIPVREGSKNWKWKGKEPGQVTAPGRDRRKTKGRDKKSGQAPQASQRPYGWLDIRVAANTTVSYSMDMVAAASGYSNCVRVDIPSTEISSSINHELLWRSGPQHITCDLSTPLRWNALRQWRFNVASDDLELFLLRDHVFLLIDLVDDWTTGPPPEYLVFTPFKYYIDLRLHNVKIYLNVNDANIINNPTDTEDNTYLLIGSPLLESSICIPADTYRPSKNAIPFDIRADPVTIRLHAPPWNTQATFLSSPDIGHLENLSIDGAYHYNATTSPANTDTLVMNITGQSPAMHLYGFVVRYFLKVKDNYFGDDIHFKTLEEHQETLRLKESDPDAEKAGKPPHKQSNDLDVILNIRADDPKVILPGNLYSSNRHVQIDTASLNCDMRFTNYYMDFTLVLSPLSLSRGSANDGMETPLSASSSTQLFVDGLTVYGHRLFGLPPVEPTYLCNWDLSVGDVTGECSADFLAALVAGGKAFGFSMDDDENALVPYSSIVFYDVTFLRASVRSINLWLRVEEAAFLLSTGPIDVNYNDWARSHYSRRANITIPDIKFSCTNSDAAARNRSRSHHPVEADAIIQTSAHIAIIGRKFDFSNERKLQQRLVQREDQRTHRAAFLVLPGQLGGEPIFEPVNPPAQCFPDVPQPTRSDRIRGDTPSLASSVVQRQPQWRRNLRSKSSFLSLSSSSSRNSVARQPTSKSRRPLGNKRLLASADRRPGQLDRPATRHTRDTSVSTGRHSAYYTVPGDAGDSREAERDTVAFSSQYFPPSFPLRRVKPDAGAFRPRRNTERSEDSSTESVGFDLEDIDADFLGEDFALSSVVLELPTGLDASLTPTSLRHLAALVAALQPSQPEDILDDIQIDSMSEIFSMQKGQKMSGHVNDLLLRIPKADIRFINTPDPDASHRARDEQDQYDFSITKLALASRSETKWKDAFDPESKNTRTSFHVRLRSAELSAAERFRPLDDPQAAVLAQIEHIVVSVGSKELTYLDVDVGSAQGQTSSRKIEYLASLIHRTTVLGSELGNIFQETTSRQHHLVKYLVHHLMADRQGAPDAAFLVRPSAVLRSARQHLRTFDSWKLAMRLRQMWITLPPDKREQLKLECFGPLPELPSTIREESVASFQRWRSWDLRDASESVLLNKVFGRAVVHSASAPAPEPNAGSPTLAVVRVKEAQLVLDPGPKQNEVVVLDLTVRLQDYNKVPPENDSSPAAVADGPLTVINVYCDDASVNLNWELCELADDVLKLYNNRTQAKPDSPSSPDKSPPPTTPAPSPPRTLHYVACIGRGSVTIETVNVHASSRSNNLKTSLIRRTGREVSDTNLVISCDSAQSKLRYGAQALSKAHLHNPSILISHELRASETADEHTVKATASSRQLSLVVRQDPVVLSEVVDAVIRDEVAQLYRLKDRHLPTSSQVSSTPSPDRARTDHHSVFRVNVAMFMDEYTLEVPLLRSLTYSISGTVSRAAMAANPGEEVVFDFDVKENSHEMRVVVNDVARRISLLQIPPTNGKITSSSGSGERSITVFASLELVELDASAVYSLLSALNRPEVTSTIDELQQQAQTIRDRIADIFGPQDSAPTADVSSAGREKADMLVYAVHLTFAGLRVFGSSPLKSDLSPLAYISFSLDSINLGMTNRIERRGPVFDYPEVRINFRQISFEIKRGTADAMDSCGSLAFGALVTATSRAGDNEEVVRSFNVRSDSFEVELSADTISTAVDVLGYMGDKIKDLDTSRELEYLRKIRQSKPRIVIDDGDQTEKPESDLVHTFLSNINYTFEACDIKVSWLVTRKNQEPSPGKEDLVLSLGRIEFGTRTRNSARLTIENLQVQMVSALQDRRFRSPNSALLPEVVFNIAYVSAPDARRLAFQAVGKSLDLQLHSGFIIPAANLKDSISLSIGNAQRASQNWNPVMPPVVSPVASASESPKKARQRGILGSKRLESLLVDADFAGAVVHLTSKKDTDPAATASRSQRRGGLGGKYGQFTQDDSGSTVLRTPGLACKVEYADSGQDDPTLYAEVKVDASSNIIYPSVVPLIIDMTNTVKEVVSSDDDHGGGGKTQDTPARPKATNEENILTSDPSAVLGRIKLNIGMRIYKQEFSLSCQPIARVAATAGFEDVYFTINTVRSVEQGNFFALSGAFTGLRASVQHVYSRESTGSFEVESIVLSLMNSKHVSGTSGLSAIIKVSPMQVSINAKQLQDFLLFREIWMPGEIRQGSSAPVAKLATEASQGHLVQRYQQVAATAAFPWTATISISALEINLDLGQALGKPVFAITEFWVSSKKTSDWEQNLCLGFQRIGIDSTGRMSGFVALQDFQLRTSIKWPEREQALNETPLIQASIGFDQLRVKVAFDYQVFLVADITSMEFIMYNVRRSREGAGDRLVAIFDGNAVQAFGTTTSAAQGVALYQAIRRLIQEKRSNYEASLKEIEKFLKRRPESGRAIVPRASLGTSAGDDALLKSPILLDTDVVVTLKALNLGIFPSAFTDHQVFKMEALNAQARFAASIEESQIHSILGLTLGQLRIGLAGVGHAAAAASSSKAAGELSVEDVVQRATGSRGGTILKVPRVEATMQTWQSPEANHIDYIFKSSFEGKVEVGWNYSRISYIRGMWANHAKALAQSYGRELPAVTAIRVTGVPEAPEGRQGQQHGGDGAAPAAGDSEGGDGGGGQAQTGKITAEVNVPQSKYHYRALQPPIIETPQLRDMGEATPPLEWIGLQRDRLPNLTHQIVIVSLLELASEVEDAYSRILGSS